MREPFPLRGRTALVTGASRRAGIGFATACRLASYGASVFVHHWTPHDDEQDWGSDDVRAVVDGVGDHLVDDAGVADRSADPTAAGAPEAGRRRLGSRSRSPTSSPTGRSGSTPSTPARSTPATSTTRRRGRT